MKCLLFMGAIALTSCDYRSGPLPDRSEIIRVEQALSKARCIGKIRDWGRIYQYHLEPSSVAPFLSRLHRGTIDFDLSAGPTGSVVWLRPPYPPVKYILDDLSKARGSYDLRSGDLKFVFCEPVGTPRR